MGEAVKIEYGKNIFDIRLERKKRKTMTISVLPDGSIEASAPISAEIEDITARLKKRARWIKKQKVYFSQFDPRTPAPRYVPGETHLYLGKQYRLRHREDIKSNIKLTGKFLEITGPKFNSSTAEKLLKKWYREMTVPTFSRRLDVCMRRFPQTPRPELHIRRFKSRWGGMSKSGKLTLNADLIRAPIECIDYVIVHELCHIEHPHHGSKFWKLLNQKLPAWQTTKHKLEIALS